MTCDWITTTLLGAKRCMGLALLLVAAGCTAPPETGSASQDAPQPWVHSLRQRHICGAALARIRNARVHSIDTASGCDPALDVRPDSAFQAASLSKPVFAYAVLKLVQQGHLALDTPVLHYLPQGYRHAYDPLHPERRDQSDEVTAPQLAAVTVRMLLQHTSGLPNWAPGPLYFESHPGQRWIYSGEGYVLLQRAIEATMQRPLDEVIREVVFDPLGMDRSSYRWTPEIGKHLLPGTRTNGALRKTALMHQPVAAFSLYTTAEDYSRFVIALLRDPYMLTAITESPVAVDPNLNLSWGLGWGLERSDDGVNLWQWGHNPGYRAFVMAAPKTGDALVLLTNSDAGLRLVSPWLRSSIVGEHPVLRSKFLSTGIVDRLCDLLDVCF